MSLIIDVNCDRLPNTAIPSVMFCSMMIPGNVAGVAKQFLRCMFHQLAPNGILPQLFQSNIKGLLTPLMTNSDILKIYLHYFYEDLQNVLAAHICVLQPCCINFCIL